jgi:metallo-beta-lactamase class B
MRLMRVALALLAPAAVAAQNADSVRRAAECPSCAEWNAPHAPLKLFGNTYYVGTGGLSSILITSPQGHILIDGGLPESAAPILAHIRELGFRVEDVKLVLNSHAHYDHAGGLAAIQAATGAEVAASPPSAREIEKGAATEDDPQYHIALRYPRVQHVRVLHDGETMHVGPLAIAAHFTGGHTPGGTSWTWRSCEGARCMDVLYADSFSAVSDPDFLFTKSTTYPGVLADFEHSFAFLDSTPCDLLFTPHPGQSRLWERVAARDNGTAPDLRSDGACARYAAAARTALAKRVAEERAR